MDTSVSTPAGRFYNIGLLEKQRSATLVALVLIVLNAGSIGIAAGSRRRISPKAPPSRSPNEKGGDAGNVLSLQERTAKRALRYKAVASTLFALLIGAPAGALAAALLAGLLMLALGSGLLDILLLALPLLLIASLAVVYVWTFRRCSDQQRILQVLKWDASALVVWSIFEVIELAQQPELSTMIIVGVLSLGALGTLYSREHLKEVPIWRGDS